MLILVTQEEHIDFTTNNQFTSLDTVLLIQISHGKMCIIGKKYGVYSKFNRLLIKQIKNLTY